MIFLKLSKIFWGGRQFIGTIFNHQIFHMSNMTTLRCDTDIRNEQRHKKQHYTWSLILQYSTAEKQITNVDYCLI